MFNGNQSNKDINKNTTITNSSSVNIIGEGTEIKGDINSNGDIRIDGKIHGKIFSKAKVVIGTTGEVNGDITCCNADISGKIDGEIKVQELLFLKSTSCIEGQITTEKLVIESGAEFNGECKMGAGNVNEKLIDKDHPLKKEAV